jgi:starch synthase (maltosyl-transferring)
MMSDALPGREEYLNSEKFQICHYDWKKENKVSTIISKINQIRHHIENDNLLAFYKWNQDKTNELLIIISLDPYYAQQGSLQLPLSDFGIQHGQRVQVHDLVTGSSYHWYDEWNFIELHPTLPFHIFKINR